MDNIISEIFDNRYEELKQYIVQADSKTVWDYKKQDNTTKIFLISEEAQDIGVEESVTVLELKKLIVDNYIPIKSLKLLCEHSRQQYTKYSVNKDDKTVNLRTNG